MGKKRHLKRKKVAAERAAETGDLELNSSLSKRRVLQDPARALIAIHPSADTIAVAYGSTLHVFNIRTNSQVSVEQAEHEQTIRVVAFDRSGKFMLTAGDDKSVRVWECHRWTCIMQTTAGKRLSAAVFSAESRHVLFADKFGDVLVSAMPTRGSEADHNDADPNSSEGVVASKPHLLLGHFSSIVTSLSASPDNRWIASTDRERKVRITMFPKQPLAGAPCIQSFCLGHTAFVTSSAFIASRNGLLLATGSGDGTVRLWDPEYGKLLDTYCTTPHTSYQPPADKSLEQDKEAVATSNPPDADAMTSDQEECPATVPALALAFKGQALPEQKGGADFDMRLSNGLTIDQHGEAVTSNALPASEQLEAVAAAGMVLEEACGEEEDDRGLIFEELPPAVLAISICRDGSLLAAAIEGEDAVLLLSVVDGKFALKTQAVIPEVTLPCSLAFDNNNNLWAVGGSEPDLPLTVGCAPITSLEQTGAEEAKNSRTLCTEDMRSALGAVQQDQVRQRGEASSKKSLQVSEELRKRSYLPEELARRKRNRADIKGGIEEE